MSSASIHASIRRCVYVLCALSSLARHARAEQPPNEPPFATAAERGYWLLLNKAYLPPDFDQETFDALWKNWDAPARAAAEKASPDERRALAYKRYGLIERPDDQRHRPLQYVVSESGEWSMNCLACHQGSLDGRAIPGLANARYDMQSLYEDVRATKLRAGKPLTHMDIGSTMLPLGSGRGTTNAVMFGVVLLNFRKPDLSLDSSRPLPTLTHHDHDAPAWWHYRRKTTIYCDGFATKSHRALMQFLLVKQNGPAQFAAWEDDYRDIERWLESLAPPKFEGPIDRARAARGGALFNDHCARCHGTYGEHARWPAKTVPIATVGTDPTRLNGLNVAQRKHYADSWFAHAGADRTATDPAGYVAPPLDGVWASAPYFHNGGVPTLAQVLDPDARAKIWRRVDDRFDPNEVGLRHERVESIPSDASAQRRREYYDSSAKGKSNAGHDFAAKLSDAERRALLEYLKTL